MTEGELCPDEARTAENGPTEAQWHDEGRPEAKYLIHHSTEAPILLHFRRTPGSPGKCRFNAAYDRLKSTVPSEIVGKIEKWIPLTVPCHVLTTVEF